MVLEKQVGGVLFACAKFWTLSLIEYYPALSFNVCMCSLCNSYYVNLWHAPLWTSIVQERWDNQKAFHIEWDKLRPDKSLCGMGTIFLKVRLSRSKHDGWTVCIIEIACHVPYLWQLSPWLVIACQPIPTWYTIIPPLKLRVSDKCIRVQLATFATLYGSLLLVRLVESKIIFSSYNEFQATI